MMIESFNCFTDIRRYMKILKWFSLMMSIIGLIILLASLAAPGSQGQTAVIGAIGLAVIPYIVVGAIERLRVPKE